MALAFDPAPLDLIDDSLWVFDLDRFRVLWANAAAVALWRADSLEDLQARDFSALSDVARSRLRDYADRFRRNETVEADWTFRPGGIETTVRCRCKGVILADRRVAMLVHVIPDDGNADRDGEARASGNDPRQAHDELARAEARFRAFAEIGSDWLWETDDEHRFRYFSNSIFNLHGFRPQDLLGLTRSELFKRYGVDQEATLARPEWVRHQDELKALQPFRDLRYAIRRPDGAIRHCSISGTPMFDADGRFQGYRGTGRDLTDTVVSEERERELLRERDAAIAASSIMNQFLATMSHELRTPLNAVIGFSEILAGEMFGSIDNPKYRGYAGDIRDSAQHLLSVVDDLLDLSRLEMAEADSRKERQPASELMESALRVVRLQAKVNRIDLRAELDDPELILDLDIRGARQILLLNNTLYVGAVADPAQIWVVDANTLKLKARIKNTGKWMTGLHYSAQTGRLYAANGGGEILGDLL